MPTMSATAVDVLVDHKVVRKIACLGSGFVGGPTSAVTAFKSNVEVTVVDINPERIAAWNSDFLPVYEPGLHEIVRAARDGVSIDATTQHVHLQPHIGHNLKANLYFSTNVDKAIADADLIFVCVNTPTKANGIGKGSAADLGFVEAATRNIARVATEDKIVVEKSTVPCRTAQSIREILTANARPGVRFDVLSNPEFLAEGTAVRDLLDPDRVIIGSISTAAGHRAAASLVEVYANWIPKERILTMNLWSSELSKLASNALLAQRISSVNALSAICEATGADVDEVAHACGLDSRIGPHMLKAGPGFGGSCFQKDIFNIVYLSESLHLYEVADYWRGIIKMNEHQKNRFTRRIISCLFNNLTGKKLAVLGFAFKKDTSDTRETPAITLVTNLVAEKGQVAIYDPKVQEAQIWKELVADGGSLKNLEEYVSVCKSAYEACAGADAVIVVTEWDEFSNKIVVTEWDEVGNKAPATSPVDDSSHNKIITTFQIPPKRSASLVIRSPITGDIVTFPKPSAQHASLASSENRPPPPDVDGNSPLKQHPSTQPLPLTEINPNLPKSPTRVNRHMNPHNSKFSPPRSPKGMNPQNSGFSPPLSPKKTHSRQSMPSIEERLNAFNFGSNIVAKSEPLDWARIAIGMRKPAFVFDGRNMLDGEALEKLGFRYEAIGKASKPSRISQE